MKNSASMLLVIHILLPLILNPLSVSVAFVARANASEPLTGSDKQKDPTVLVARRGRYFFLSDSLPHLITAVLTSVLCTSTMTDTEGSTRASSSMPTMAAVKFIPAPPYSSGISIPIRPCSNSCSTTVGSICSASSISRTFGRMMSLANFCTVSAMAVSTSEKCVIGVGATSARLESRRGAVVERGRAHWATNGCRILGADTATLLRTAGRNALAKDLILQFGRNGGAERGRNTQDW
uniref:Secreted protein n=1 Tax=Phakopsora pachyrhizi TaxID=170000 RepID=A0A0S1MJ07_PHAPC